MNIGCFNKKGELAFQQFLEDIRTGRKNAPPEEMLTDADLLEQTWPTELHRKRLATRLHLAQYVDDALSRANIENDMHSNGVWSWLAALLFDSICPKDKTGKYSPGADYSYIPSEMHWHFYRHRIRGPVRTLRIFKENPSAASIILCQDPSKPGDFVEQLASRQERVTCASVIEVATKLYFDASRRAPKRGAAPNERKPGTLRRYIDVLDQLELTYDLYAVSSLELINLLPAEFSKWKGAGSAPN